MILTAKEIEKEVKKGNIIIDPFDKKCLKPNSYIYHLGDTLVEVLQVGDKKKKPKTRKVKIPAKGYVLEPRRLYLGTTIETIGSKYFVPIIKGRSSTGRLGIFVNITADLIDLGSIQKPTLTIHVVKPIKIYPNTKIGQVTFWVTK